MTCDVLTVKSGKVEKTLLRDFNTCCQDSFGHFRGKKTMHLQRLEIYSFYFVPSANIPIPKLCPPPPPQEKKRFKFQLLKKHQALKNTHLQHSPCFNLPRTWLSWPPNWLRLSDTTHLGLHRLHPTSRRGLALVQTPVPWDSKGSLVNMWTFFRWNFSVKFAEIKCQKTFRRWVFFKWLCTGLVNIDDLCCEHVHKVGILADLDSRLLWNDEQ